MDKTQKLKLTSPSKLNLGKATRISSSYGISSDSVSPVRGLRSPLKTLSEPLRPLVHQHQPSRQFTQPLVSPVRRSGSPERRQRILELEWEGRPDKKPKTVTMKPEPEIMPEQASRLVKFLSEASVSLLVKEANALLHEMRETQLVLVAEVRELRQAVEELRKNIHK